MKTILIALLAFMIAGCAKENKTFSLKTIRLNDYTKTADTAQQLYLEIFDANSSTPLARTGLYPAGLPLPATLKVYPVLPLKLYKEACHIELWSNVSGYISSCDLHMSEYKIIFPIDMEVKSDSLNVSVMGTWQ